MKQLIHIKLLDEGTLVYRPVSATELNNGIYIVEGKDIYDADGEKWSFHRVRKY